ncbi:MAG: hypothetical protein E7462_01380 [Ruminococcaceae bacterium]|nr:hypothetical protein [Oscillospiraceae bacterium]
MGNIKEYIIGVVAAALLCGIVIALADKKGVLGVSLKLLSGLLLVLAVISPWTTISFDRWFGWSGSIGDEGAQLVADGEKMAQESYRASIKEQLEAYILDEARALDCTLRVEVTLSEEEPAVPERVVLSGSISPYARKTMEHMLHSELGISQEEQIWIG